MLRWIVSLGAALLAVNAATAHFFFLLPGAAQQPPKLVLSDTPLPDVTVSLDPAQQGKFFAVSRTGDVSPLAVQKADTGAMTFGLLPADTATVTGTVDYGVVVRGQAETVLIRHHAKLVVAAPITQVQKTPPAPVEINPVLQGGSVAFQVTVNGKPVEADVTVYAPDAKRVEVVRTDVKGMTKGFDKKGQYAARVLVTEKTNGEYQGRAYKQVRNYATVVTAIE